MPARIAIDQEQIAAFCERHRIRKLALFGSVLRDDFRALGGHRGHAQPLVHGYDAIRFDRVWAVLADDLPPLIAALEAALANAPEPR